MASERTVEEQVFNIFSALADSVMDMTDEEIMEETFENQFTLPLVGGVDKCVRDANGNIVGEPQLEQTATDYDAKLITEYIARCINQHTDLIEQLAAANAEIARLRAKNNELQGVVDRDLIPVYEITQKIGDKLWDLKYVPAGLPHVEVLKWLPDLLDELKQRRNYQPKTDAE